MNPYNAAPKTGFTLTTYDDSGCAIETSTDMNITVSEFATITTAGISRASGGTTTVDELSTMIATFTLDLPVDSGC